MSFSTDGHGYIAIKRNGTTLTELISNIFHYFSCGCYAGTPKYL